MKEGPLSCFTRNATNKPTRLYPCSTVVAHASLVVTQRNILSLSHSQATLIHIHPSLRMKTSQVDRLLRLCGTLYSHFTRRNTTNHLLHILSTYSTNPFMLFKVQTSLVRNEFPSSSMSNLVLSIHVSLITQGNLRLLFTAEKTLVFIRKKFVSTGSQFVKGHRFDLIVDLGFILVSHLMISYTLSPPPKRFPIISSHPIYVNKQALTSAHKSKK